MLIIKGNIPLRKKAVKRPKKESDEKTYSYPSTANNATEVLEDVDDPLYLGHIHDGSDYPPELKISFISSSPTPATLTVPSPHEAQDRSDKQTASECQVPARSTPTPAANEHTPVCRPPRTAMTPESTVTTPVSKLTPDSKRKSIKRNLQPIVVLDNILPISTHLPGSSKPRHRRKRGIASAETENKSDISKPRVKEQVKAKETEKRSTVEYDSSTSEKETAGYYQVSADVKPPDDDDLFMDIKIDDLFMDIKIEEEDPLDIPSTSDVPVPAYNENIPPSMPLCDNKVSDQVSLTEDVFRISENNTEKEASTSEHCSFESSGQAKTTTAQNLLKSRPKRNSTKSGKNRSKNKCGKVDQLGSQDMYHVFGMHIAKTLRDIDDDCTFTQVKIKMNDILLEALAGHYRTQGLADHNRDPPENPQTKILLPINTRPQVIILPGSSQNNPQMILLPNNSQTSNSKNNSQMIVLPNNSQTNQNYVRPTR